MIVREVVNGMVRKPYVVNWSEMSDVGCITSKVRNFRTAWEADAFISSLPRMKGFMWLNSAYCIGGGSYRR